MNRKDFVRNILLGLTAMLLPETLRPMDGVIKSGSVEDVVITKGNFMWERTKGGVYFYESKNGKWEFYRYRSHA